MLHNNFSVLMSLYDKEKPIYLHQCLESLYQQTLQPDEIVIIFDGSINVELEAVISKWKSILPLKIFKTEKNMGLGYSLNFGLLQCKHNLIARMDTDDICFPDRFEKQIAYMCKMPEISILGSNVIEYDETMSNIITKKTLALSHNDIIKFIKKRNPFNHMSVILRKDIIMKSGNYQHHIFMEDYNLWIRVISLGYKVENLSDRLLKVRTGNAMIKKRRGISYIKSELKLAKLKVEKNIDSFFPALLTFILRSIIRILPTSLLSKVYRLIRK
ncbi:putative UDP-galactose--lipooligosaccharide galactosyltransferase [Xenorhabdus mauleonii]|uniref:Amylovoran biosynthesis glycosyltransferase AmsE n=1 Tax=Xenorhabdus mauleonii TaxID=351675 RepID=A0A1I3TXQ1_9GAMM|nr:glycosyltransferase [Xenorhabdus mauleonii]PHM39566.1 putative UDP-galactose--lipooligosaccharide galactosyltransferase [Xenorhabdus mauleonii]SFJ75253.1 amylovoran biosynthesis glycosyltransferase AmsE [Xenorhabdus mauleonii]